MMRNGALSLEKNTSVFSAIPSRRKAPRICPTPDNHWGHWLNGGNDVLLWLFLLGTYAIAPVQGFGGILAMMGATQTTSLHRANIYFAMLVVLQLLEVTFQYRV